MLRVVIASACLLVSTIALAQTRPSFEVASVRASAEQGQQGVAIGLRVDGAQARIASLSLRDYIAMAYRVRSPQVVAPEWTGQTRFDVAGTIPSGNTREQVPEMLQSLLEERFQLKYHHEQRELPVYALAVAKNGLRVKPIADDPQAPAPAVNVSAGGSAAGVAIDLGAGSTFTLADNRIEARHLSFTQLADLLSRFFERPVIDATRQPGRYDLNLELTPEDYQVLMIRAAVRNGVVLPPQALRVLDTASGNPLASALDAVGLTIDATRAPLDTIVVDSVSRTPTEN